jgi:hypothetical protein
MSKDCEDTVTSRPAYKYEEDGRDPRFQRTHCYQYSFTQAGPDVPSQHAVVILAGFLSNSWLHSSLEPSIKILVKRDLGAFEVTTQVTFPQFPSQVCLRFAHGSVDRSIVVFAFFSFVIAAEINPDEPSAIASCDDLANFASHRDFLLGSQREAHYVHTQ